VKVKLDRGGRLPQGSERAGRRGFLKRPRRVLRCAAAPGEQTINISVDPDRAAALIAMSKSWPGVVAAGWTSGVVEMERTIRFFSAADWRDGRPADKDKLAAAIGRGADKGR